MRAFFKLSFITLILALATGLRANSYWGTITQTVTHSDSSYYQVGMVLQGWYCYEADGVDGVFTGLDSRWELPGQPLTLKGEVYGFFGLFNLLGTLTVGDSFGYQHYTSLTVQDGDVDNFNMDGQSGGSDYRFYFDHFKCTEILNGRVVEGSLSFGAPMLKSGQNVPDGTSTLFGVCAGFVVLGVFVRWRFQKLAVSERAYVRVRQSP